MTDDQLRDGVLESRLRAAIRNVPDYPKPGILFRDITPLLANPELFAAATTAMADPFVGVGVTHVVAIESRGFILGGPVGQRLGAGFVPVRKPGKLPPPTRHEHYALEYGSDGLEIRADAFGANACVLIVDDLLATGGTALAASRLVKSLGARVAGYSFMIALEFLGGRHRLNDVAEHHLIEY